MKSLPLFLKDESATIALGKKFTVLRSGVIFFHGELGAGKTTLIRSIIHALGYSGKVKSPTYGLMELYKVNNCQIVHLDLYRLQHAEELEFLGIRDYLNENTLVLIEWPDKANGWFGVADFEINLVYQGDCGREAHFTANTKLGVDVLKLLGSY